ncbi:MAG: hypothetical protein A2266_03870 [Bacteroidetes bacterium RIFOXYA12_FULL_40_10]|jgi:hypothetical protein|nr:MAG: hypothetical protein US49_C0022G0005 [candidate division TM6 bacterium GW2011_GWF2_37_49]OFY88696.1 MAG: hypothetical protein A2266_03870 [Bacteroidetes bacterium RIFOXYA12_FULL_40_10]PKP07056.1 MAG: hypothetical protein CVU10_05760 [Bacteroidetes bacterium HGW-Bacteroidetes-5]HBG23498.1 hypothetical protein [Rikenellaceae bacterium]
MNKKIKLIAFIVGLTLLNTTIIYATDDGDDSGSGGTETYKCFVGTYTNEGVGERTIWCGDCKAHYKSNVTGEGTCNK